MRKNSPYYSSLYFNHFQQQAKTKELKEEMQYGSKPVTPAKRRFNTPAKSPGNTTKLRKVLAVVLFYVLF